MAVRSEEAQINIIINGQKATSTIKDMESASKVLNAQIKLLAPGTQEFIDKTKQLQQVNSRLKETKAAVKGVEEGMGFLKKSSGFLNSFFGNMASGLVSGFTDKIMSFGRESVKAFEESQQATAQLQASLKSTGGAAGITETEIKSLSSSLQDLTNIDDDVTNSAASLLLTFTEVKNKAFKEAIPLIQDMAVKMAGGSGGEIDLKSATIQVGKALNDPIKGITALSKVGVSFTQQQKEQITAMVKAGDVAGAQRMILAELRKEFGGSAEAAAKFQGVSGKLTSSMGELSEIIGEKLKQGVSGVQSVFLSLVNSARDFLSIPMSQKLQEEQTELNTLVIAIKNTNDNQEARNALISELQTKYPDFLGNLDAEKVTNEQLSQRLSEVNKQYVNKIILQKQQEKIEDQAKTQAEMLQDVINQEKIIAKLIKQRQAYSGITKKDTETTEQFFERTNAAVEKNFNALTANDQKLAALGAVSVLKGNQDAYNNSSKAGNKLLEEKIELEKRLGIEVTKPQKTAITRSGGGSTDPNKDKEHNKQLADFRKAEEDYDKLLEKDHQKHLDNLRQAEGDYEEFLAKQRADNDAAVKAGRQAEEAYDEEMHDKAIRAKFAINDLEIIKAKGNHSKLLQLHQERLIMEKDEELRNANLTGEEKALIEEKYRQKSKELKLQDFQKTAEQIGQIGQQAIGAIQDLTQAISDRNVQKEESDKARRLANLDQELSSKKISEKNYQKEKAKIEADADKRINAIKTKQAKADKAASVAQAVIAAALAVVKALPNPVTATIAGVLGAIQVAKIIATPIPAYAHGGMTGTGTYKDYTGHKVAGVVHANEWVGPQWMTQHPIYGPQIQYLEGVRQKGYADGGFTSDATPSVNPNNAAQQASSAAAFSQDQVIMAINRNTEEIKNMKKNIKAYIVYSELQEANATIASIQADSSI